MRYLPVTAFAASALVIAALALGSAQAQEIKPGKWQVTVEGVSEIGGQKTNLPTNQMETCITAEQSKQIAEQATLPQMEGCKADILSRNASGLTVRANCQGVVSTSTITTAGDTYKAVTHMEMTQGGAKMITDMTSTGTRIGTCAQ
ncbi:DUF3617 domain-containing protein [Dongia soli]|uniref:DUF3617 family protein n=1 Tax=Dongia soli TaxID=600628 RepID=A0ABU5EDF4_9PROT|nr:DUF3617 family protein [Dongia soli]MDY0883473.1 DUF3617 family protein [Dongia soli]